MSIDIWSFFLKFAERCDSTPVLTKMLEGLRKDIEKLIALYEKEKAAREKLEAELSQSKAVCESYRKQIEDLEQQVDSLRLAEAFMAPVGSDNGAKEKIDRLIKEIDKCISLMEN